MKRIELLSITLFSLLLACTTGHENLDIDDSQVNESVDDLPQVVLNPSGPIDVKNDGTAEEHFVVENLQINSPDHEECGIRIVNRKHITVRNVDIKHAGAGICVHESEDIKIEFARVINTIDHPGPHCRPGLSDYECKRVSNKEYDESETYPADSHNNITIKKSNNVSIDTVYLEKGEAGVLAHRTSDFTLNNFHCVDIRGPYYRGQCAMVTELDGAKISNFYIQQFLESSSGHDNINAYEATNVSVSNGLIDGNWSENGVGAIADKNSHNMTVSNVDFIHMGLGATNPWSGSDKYDDGTVPRNFTAENLRVKDGHCTGTWRGPETHPSSGGLAFSMHPAAKGVKYINSQYWNQCGDGPVYTPGKPEIVDIREENFELKDPPIDIRFPWL